MRPPRLYNILAALLLITSTAYADPPIDYAAIDPSDHAYDRWYLDTLDGQPSGYWRTVLRVDDDNTIYSLYEVVGYEKHGGELTKTHRRVEWLETIHHQPLSIQVYQEIGSEGVSKTYRFMPDGIRLTTTQGNRTNSEELPPIQGDYLTASQFAIAFDRHLASGKGSFELAMLDPLVGMTPYTVRYDKQQAEPEPFAVTAGEHVDATRWTVTYSILPGIEGYEWIDGDGQSIGLSYDIGGMTLVARLADEMVADTAFDPPEMAQLSVVVPDRSIEQIDRQRRIVYELSYDGDIHDIVPINTIKQSIEKQDNGSVRVTVDLDAQADQEHDRPSDANLAATIYIDHEDEVVRQLAEQAVQHLRDNATRERIARACKRFVTRHMSVGSLSVGDATASEAARTRRGDCTECAVLLAALLRAHGIPSRCVNGLVYSEDEFVSQRNVFVYHLWTQAWIEDENGNGQWLDLDAAMWRYTAGHIALGVSDMGDDDQQDWIQLIPMMQGLEIKVIETQD